MRWVFRAVLMIAIIAMGGYLLGLWSADDLMMGRWRRAIPWAGQPEHTAVREGLDRLDERTGRAVVKVDAYLSDGGVSGKIKSKMALDDLVRASAIDVSTTGGIVTLAGSVRSIAERDQAIRLARNTTGVTQVIDHLVVAR